MDLKYLILFVISLIACTPVSVFSQEFQSPSGLSFLKMDVGARAQGLSGAYTAISNDASTIFYNPAGLSALDENISLGSSISTLSFGRYNSSFFVAKTIENVFGFGAGFQYNYFGSFLGRNNQGTPTGEFVNYGLLVTSGASYNFSNVSVGVVGKYVQSTLTNENLSGEGFFVDLGVKMPFLDVITIGSSIQNIGSFNWNSLNNSDDSKNTIFRFGLSTEIPLELDTNSERESLTGDESQIPNQSIKYLLLSLDSKYVFTSNSPTISAAAEYSLSEGITVRTGFSILSDFYGETKYFNFQDAALGISYKFLSDELIFPIQLDYSLFRNRTALSGISHSFSLLIQI